MTDKEEFEIWHKCRKAEEDAHDFEACFSISIALAIVVLLVGLAWF